MRIGVDGRCPNDVRSSPAVKIVCFSLVRRYAKILLCSFEMIVFLFDMKDKKL